VTTGPGTGRLSTTETARGLLAIMAAREARPLAPKGLTSLHFKQNAKADWLVEDLGFDQREGETDDDFYARCELGKCIVQEMIGYMTPDTLTADLEASLEAQKGQK